MTISVAGISFLRSYLITNADRSLQPLALLSRGPVEGCLAQDFQGCQETREGVAVYWLPADGSLRAVIQPVKSAFGQSANQSVPGPALQPSLSWLEANPGKTVTVSAVTGDGRWRVVAIPVQFQDTGSILPTLIRGDVITASDVTGVYQTTGRLVLIDLIVSAILLAALAAIGVTTVRRSLRPLADIEDTAGKIASGELSQRVPEWDPRTEVGSLGRSLNLMLAQIETAFGARERSEAAARVSEERMRRFIADASHELRTPVTVIRGYAEYYRQRGGQDKLPGTEVDRVMERVEGEAARMGGLVQDLLLLARLDQQRPLERTPVDLLALAGDAVADARVMAPGRDITLTVLPGEAPIVAGDEARLRQVISNLMSNALTHTPEGTPVTVRLGTGPYSDPPVPSAWLEVADRGPGMSAEQASQVFERFYRGDAARDRRTGGSGLGLAIVWALVAAHGGTVTLETAEGNGAAFRMLLPLAPEGQASPVVSGPAAAGTAAS